MFLSQNHIHFIGSVVNIKLFRDLSFYFDIQTNHFSSYSAQTITLTAVSGVGSSPVSLGVLPFRPPTDWPVSYELK